MGWPPPEPGGGRRIAMKYPSSPSFEDGALDTAMPEWDDTTLRELAASPPPRTRARKADQQPQSQKDDR